MLVLNLFTTPISLLDSTYCEAQLLTQPLTKLISSLWSGHVSWPPGRECVSAKSL